MANRFENVAAAQDQNLQDFINGGAGSNATQKPKRQAKDGKTLGRPKSEKKREKMVNIYMTLEEHAQLVELAKKNRMTISSYVNMVLFS